MEAIIRFDGDYRFLSNFYGCDVVYDGDTYPSAENAYQAAKTLDKNEREKFKSAAPNSAKRMGQKLNLRGDWEQVKISIMTEIVENKFANNQGLGQKLLDTKDALLIEGNYWHDNYWGACYCEKCKGKGKNELGEILMSTRKGIGFKCPYLADEKTYGKNVCNEDPTVFGKTCDKKNCSTWKGIKK